MKNTKIGLINICEMFYSFQGESTLVGRPTIFIRLSTCNLNCTICDTKYALRDGKKVSIKKIIDIAQSIKTPYVCITGGEPLLQMASLKELIKALFKIKKTISIETNGSLSIKNLPKKVKKIVDIKTPSSTEADSFKKINLKYLGPDDELKLVISDQRDMLFAKKLISSIVKKKPDTLILLSPNMAKKGLPKKLVNWIIKEQLPVVFQPQIHKLIKEEPIYLL
jgi:7-carboxy-7-deazaguanine synthase